MSRSFVAGFTALLLAVPVAAQTPPTQSPATQTPAAQVPAGGVFPADARVGFVNLQVVLAKSNLGQRLSAELKAVTDERDAALATRQKEIADIEGQLSGPARQTMSQEAANALVSTLNRKRAELNFEAENWQIRVEEASQTMLGKFREEMLPAIEAVREERGLSLVLSLPFPGVVAVDGRLDLSAELIRKLDERTK